MTFLNVFRIDLKIIVCKIHKHQREGDIMTFPYCSQLRDISEKAKLLLSLGILLNLSSVSLVRRAESI